MRTHLQQKAVRVTGYQRDRVGRWRYTSTGGFVPGARDVNLDRSWNFTRTEETVYVPVAALIVDPELRWCSTYLGDTRTGNPQHDVIAVPIAAWNDYALESIGIDAPELTPTRLLDIGRLAAALGLQPSTIRSYVTRGQFPAPNVTGFGSPMWALPIIVHHLRARQPAPVTTPPKSKRRISRPAIAPRSLDEIDRALAEIETNLARLGLGAAHEDELDDENQPDAHDDQSEDDTFSDRYRFDN